MSKERIPRPFTDKARPKRTPEAQQDDVYECIDLWYAERQRAIENNEWGRADDAEGALWRFIRMISPKPVFSAGKDK